LYCLLWELFALFVGALLFGSCSEVLSEVGQAGAAEFVVVIQGQGFAAAGAASVLFMAMVTFPVFFPESGGIFAVTFSIGEPA
jgi:hypothetical protein